VAGGKYGVSRGVRLPRYDEQVERLRPPVGRSDPLDAKSSNAGRDTASGKNILLIEGCDIVLANVAPFRGPHADDGTAFEVGYATGLDLPVLCYAVEGALRPSRTSRLATPVPGRGHGPLLDKDGWTVEDFGLPVNLMLVDPAGAASTLHRRGHPVLGQAKWKSH
jgi:nucleoside 2-deoxyribosyltransferase